MLYWPDLPTVLACSNSDPFFLVRPFFTATHIVGQRVLIVTVLGWDTPCINDLTLCVNMFVLMGEKLYRKLGSL